jgi:hypothetical protein
MYQANSTKGLTLKQLQLSNTMRRLWTEHVLWTRFFIVSTAFNLPDLQFVTNRLLQNPVDFAKVLTPFYGEEIAMEFQRLLTEHLAIAGQLVNAAKAGNNEEADRQQKLWYANAEKIAKFLASINPYWSEREWRDLLFSHLRMTEDEAIDILTGHYEKSIRDFDMIQAEALRMADVMTNGIIRQFHIE